ncbi:MAG: hypothetical protein RSD65_06255 [Anaerovoracaceae bacterium]
MKDGNMTRKEFEYALSANMKKDNVAKIMSDTDAEEFTTDDYIDAIASVGKPLRLHGENSLNFDHPLASERKQKSEFDKFRYGKWSKDWGRL